MLRVTSLVACLAAVAGCGSEGDEEYANRLRPPAPIVVNASVSTEQVSISPRRFGAGPVTIIVTNQTDAAQALTLETRDVRSGAGISEETGPITPRGTGSLTADVPSGTYRVGVQGMGIRGATLQVGPQRPSAQDELLLP